MMKPGTWYVKSKSDSRWNGGGHSGCVGGFVVSQEAKDYLEAKKKVLNEEPPKDLEFGYFKD